MKKYGVKEVADITFYDLATGKPVLYLDTLKISSIENTAESSDARGGKGNPKLLTWDFNREATVTMQDALMSMKSIALMTGKAVTKGVKAVHKREILTAIAGTTGKTKVVLTETPKGVSTTFVNKVSDDTEVAIDTISTKDVNFAEADVAVGSQVAVYYQFDTDSDAETISISADSFPAYIKVVGETLIRDNDTGADEPFQFVIHKAKISPQFTLTFQAEGDPTVFDMNLTCYRTDESAEMIELIKYTN